MRGCLTYFNEHVCRRADQQAKIAISMQGKYFMPERLDKMIAKSPFFTTHRMRRTYDEIQAFKREMGAHTTSVLRRDCCMQLYVTRNMADLSHYLHDRNDLEALE